MLVPTNSPSTDRAVSETDTVSSVVLTPRSSSVFSSAAGPLPHPDEALPSIETGDSSGGSLTPSVAIDTLTSTPRHSTTDGIDTGLHHLRLSNTASPSPGINSFDLSNLGAALITNSLSPGPHLHPRDAASGNSRTASPADPRRHRRSSSRINQSPHNVQDEEPPVDKFYKPAFQNAFNEARDLMGSLARVLGSSDVHLQPDSAMKGLHQTARRLASFQCPPTRVVGLVGDSGVGKSSLLNSLLDKQNLARSSSDGAACTCVVTEYRYHETDNFSINVQPFDAAELKTQFTEMVSSYRHDRFNSEEMGTSEEQKHWEERSKVALDTLRAMFRDRITEGFLRSRGVSEDHIVETLLGWAGELGPGTEPRSHTVDSAESCAELLARLTSERVTHGGVAEWPYIKKISVSLNAYILSKGLVLVDLPGLRDLNSARRNITERYLIQCDEIFAVCRIDRATTDEGVSVVFERARQARLSNVGIICTRSDELGDTAEARRGWKGGSKAEITRLSNAISSAERAEEIVDDQIEMTRYSDEEDLDSPDEAERESRHRRDAQLNKLYRDRSRARKAVEEQKFNLQQYLIQTRNRHVTTSLGTQYRNIIPGGNLRVFCASNMFYWTHRNDIPKEMALPFLQLSGILALRRHCMSIVSEGQLRIATEYLRGDIPSLLSNIQLWVQSGAGSETAEQKEDIRRVLDALEARLRSDLTGNSSRINALARTLHDRFNQEIYERRRIPEWRQGAVRASQVWHDWHHASYSAFCRQYGSHSTPAVGYHDWNEEAMEEMTQDIQNPWNVFYLSIGNLNNEVMSIISNAMQWAVDHLGESLEPGSCSVEPLLEALTSQQLRLLADVEKIHEKFENDTLTLRISALSSLRTSFFGQAMEASYRAANLESGRGSHSCRKAIITDKMGQDRLFTDLMRRFRDDFRVLATTFQDDVKAAIAENLGIVKETLDIIRSENVALESERDPEFRERVSVELQRASDVMEKVSGMIGKSN